MQKLLLALFLMLAAPMARGACPVDQKDIDRAIEKGVEFLVDKGTEKGGKYLSSATERTGLRALVVYTLLKAGLSKKHVLIRDQIRGLSRDRDLANYDRACLLLALEAHDATGHRAWIESLTQGLIDVQEDSGAWSYPGLLTDLSNTQYAALGLWAASKAGVQVSPNVWRKLADATLLYLCDDGGYGYTFPKAGSTGSMTTAGVGLLALCEQELALAGELDETMAAELLKGRDSGVAWLDANFSVETNPGLGGHHYYYLYGLERMAALAGLSRVGSHDWYREGAAWLVENQDDDGGWNRGTDLAQTCFAILFLERATSRRGGRGVVSGPASDKEKRVKGDEGLIRVAAKVKDGLARARVALIDRDGLKGYAWPGEEKDGPRVLRVEYFVGGSPAALALGAPERPAGKDDFPAFLAPRADGALVARVWFALPPESDGLAPYVDSSALDIDLDAAPLQRVLTKGTEVGFPRAKPKASGEFRPKDPYPDFKFGGAAVCDGNPATPWLTKLKDKKLSIRVSPRKPVLAIGVIVSPPVLPACPGASVRRPTRVRLIVNGKKKGATEHELDAVGRTIIRFTEPAKVKSVELAILNAVGADDAPTGLGEIALLVEQAD